MNNQLIWEEVKANIEGHLEVNVDKIRSTNGLDVQIVMSDVPHDWLNETVSGTESLLIAALAKFRQIQIPACIDITVFPNVDSEGQFVDVEAESVRLGMTFMLIVKPPSPDRN